MVAPKERSVDDKTMDPQGSSARGRSYFALWAVGLWALGWESRISR